MEIEIQSTYSEEEMLIAREWHWRKFGFLQTGWIFGGILLILAGSFVLRDNLTLGGVFISYGVYCIFRKRILKRRYLKIIRSSPHLGKAVIWKINEDKIIQTLDIAKSESKWESFLNTVSTPDGFLVYIQKNIYFWIPISGLINKSDEPELRNLFRTMTSNREIS